MKLNKYNLFGLLLLGVLILTSTSTLVGATDDDEDGIDDDIEESNKRDVEIQFEPNEIQIESTLRNGDQKDEVKLKIGYNNEGLSIEYGYEKELTSDNTTDLDVEFQVTFRKLIEFIDMDADGIYDPLNDNAIQEYLIDSFQPIIYTTLNLSDNTALHYFIVNTTDGVFATHIYLAEEFDIVNGTFIKPTQTKIDIEITDFHYLNSTSQLALYTKLESEDDYQEDEQTENEEEGYSSNENSVIASSVDFAGFFAWTENATVDGVSKNVLASPLEVDDDDENEQKMYLNYPRGNHIYHDPIMGVMSFPTTPSDLPIVVIIAIVSSIGIGGVLLVIVLKRRRKTD